tara:strand:+ start:799 stop:1248 length:450 start_codon:yes stop_codon:yes gene_type:complete
MLRSVDVGVNLALNTLRNPFTYKLFLLLSLTVPLAIFVYIFTYKKRRAMLLLAFYAILYAVVELVKQSVASVRPNGELLSFPSRHTAFAFFIAFTFPTKGVGKIALYAWATLVGLSRLILLEHWVSDVIAGLGFGLLAGALFKKIKAWS